MCMPVSLETNGMFDVRLHLKVIDEDAKVSAVALNKVVLVAIPRACGLPRLTGLLDLFEDAVKVV